jgi:hypothetical protein
MHHPMRRSVVLLFVVLAGVAASFACAAAPALVTPEQFQNPPLTSKSRPLWFWNKATRTTAEIQEQMQKCRDESGYYGFGILPAAAPEKYLTEEYFARYGEAVRTAAKLGMKLCLYDEYWFPSGSAGGQFCKRFPELGLKTLSMQAEDVQGPKRYVTTLPPGKLMAAVAMSQTTLQRVDITGQATSQGQLVYDVPAGPWKLLLFTCTRAEKVSLMDYLDATAVRKFLEITHEEYYKRFKEYFGTTLDSAFYDEPPLYRANTWTEGFNEKFVKRFGRSPVLLYPALWLDIGPETASARNALFGFRADLFATEYIKTLDDWCRAHKIQLTGHMDQEQIVNPTCVSGDLLKVFQHQAIPGVDEIGHFGRTQRAFKLISSAAYNWDKPLVMSETFGAMPNPPVDMLYRIAMDQYAKGINFLVPHAVWLEDKKIMFPPELSWRHPTYGPALPAFNRYVGRLNLLLQGGRHVADVAVLYPIATLHAAYRFDAGNPYEGGPPVAEADYLDVGETLALDLRRDYTFLHPETLDRRCEVKDKTLCLENPVNHEAYRVVVLPGAKVAFASNLRKIRTFFDAGGSVIATGRLPDQSAEPGLDGEVRETVRHIFGVDPAGAVAPRPTATASSSFGAGYEASQAADGSLDTRWNSSDKSPGPQWLEIDLGCPVPVRRVTVREVFDRVRKYSLQAWDAANGRWSTIAEGERLGPRKVHEFKPTVTSRIRLQVDAYATNCFSIAELAANEETAAVTHRNAAGGRSWFIRASDSTAFQEAMDAALGVYDVRFEPSPTVSGGNLSYIHKVDGNRQIYFFANSSETPVETQLCLRGRLRLEFWNPHDGRRWPASSVHEKREGPGVTLVPLRLSAGRSLFLVGTVVP